MCNNDLCLQREKEYCDGDSDSDRDQKKNKARSVIIRQSSNRATYKCDMPWYCCACDSVTGTSVTISVCSIFFKNNLSGRLDVALAHLICAIHNHTRVRYPAAAGAQFRGRDSFLCGRGLNLSQIIFQIDNWCKHVDLMHMWRRVCLRQTSRLALCTELCLVSIHMSYCLR
jgi:hypothetical protein